jgi:hypothetical protein
MLKLQSYWPRLRSVARIMLSGLVSAVVRGPALHENISATCPRQAPSKESDFALLMWSELPVCRIAENPGTETHKLADVLSKSRVEKWSESMRWVKISLEQMFEKWSEMWMEVLRRQLHGLYNRFLLVFWLLLLAIFLKILWDVSRSTQGLFARSTARFWSWVVATSMIPFRSEVANYLVASWRAWFRTHVIKDFRRRVIIIPIERIVRLQASMINWLMATFKSKQAGKEEPRRPDHYYYEFLGECYVHGMMDGEAMLRKSRYKAEYGDLNEDGLLQDTIFEMR